MSTNVYLVLVNESYVNKTCMPLIVKPFSPKSDQKQYSAIKIQPIDTIAYTIQGKQRLLW